MLQLSLPVLYSAGRGSVYTHITQECTSHFNTLTLSNTHTFSYPHRNAMKSHNFSYNKAMKCSGTLPHVIMCCFPGQHIMTCIKLICSHSSPSMPQCVVITVGIKAFRRSVYCWATVRCMPVCLLIRLMSHFGFYHSHTYDAETGRNPYSPPSLVL